MVANAIFARMKMICFLLMKTGTERHNLPAANRRII